MSSSKTARIRRRQAARRKQAERLRRSGRAPQHTQTERRRAEAERQRHHFYPYVSAAQLAWPDRTDLPHPAEPDMTFDTPWVAAGTARADLGVGPVEPVSWDGSERYGPYGPNILGD